MALIWINPTDRAGTYPALDPGPESRV